MSIAAEIERLQNAKTSIKTSIENKGVEVGDGTLDTYASKIDEISSGDNSKFNSGAYLFYDNGRLEIMDELLSRLENNISCNHMYSGATELTEIDFSKIDSKYSTSSTYMLNNCKGLTGVLDFSNFDTDNCETMTYMISGCTGITKVIFDNRNVEKVTTALSMLNNCTALTDLIFTNLNFIACTTFRYLCYGCINLANVDLTNFQAPVATNYSGMFYACQGITEIDITNLYNENISNTAQMFYSCTKLAKLIINCPAVFPMAATSMLTSTPIANGTGYIYVPVDLVDTYKSATNWSTYAAQIKGISEL